LTRPASLSGSRAQQCACYAYSVCHVCAHTSFRGAKSARQSPQDVSGSGSRRVRDRIAPLISQAFRRRSFVAVGGALSTCGHKAARLATQTAAPWQASGSPHRQRVELARHRFRTSAFDPAAWRCPLARTWKRGKPVEVTTSHVTAATHAPQRQNRAMRFSAHKNCATNAAVVSPEAGRKARKTQHTCQSSTGSGHAGAPATTADARASSFSKNWAERQLRKPEQPGPSCRRPGQAVTRPGEGRTQSR
jgi:hypothetical protein